MGLKIGQKLLNLSKVELVNNAEKGLFIHIRWYNHLSP